MCSAPKAFSNVVSAVPRFVCFISLSAYAPVVSFVEFIRAVYEASTDPSLPPEKQNPTLALGYVKPGGKVIFFAGDQSSEEVDIDSRDKLIVFSRH